MKILNDISAWNLASDPTVVYWRLRERLLDELVDSNLYIVTAVDFTRGAIREQTL